MSAFAWRPMEPADIDGVVMVAAACFPDHFEARACFEERLALFAQGCFVLAGGHAVRGHLIAYPWPLGEIPPLNTLLGKVPGASGAFYLQDLAIHPEARGGGHARPAVERLVDVVRAEGAACITLVSVNDSLAFWQGMGFAPVAGDAALSRKLASYGADARYMTRAVGAG